MRRHQFVAAALAAAAMLLLAAAAFAAGRPSLECYFQTTLHDPVYQKKTYEKVAAKWKTPAAADVPAVGKKTVVQAVIAKDGALATTEISMSSGKKGWDAAALKAVKAAAPFDPLPAGFSYPTVQVHFHVSVVP
ncbi:MAG TPA: TonB family protein [Thermoanaerobaculia bacterium]